MLKQRFLLQFGSGIFLKILGMISTIVVARIVGPEVLGQVTFGMAFASLFTIITGLWGTPHIKIVAEGTPIKEAMGVFVRLKVLTMSLFLIAGFSWAHFLQEQIIGIRFDSEQLLIVDLALLAVFSHQLMKFGNTTFQARMEQVKANVPDLVKGLLFQFGRIAVVLLGFTAVGLIFWDMAAALIASIFTFLLLRRLPIGSFSKSLAKRYWGYAKPLILFMIVTVAVKYLDKVLLKEFTSENELGFYTVAFSLGGMLLLIKSQIGVVFFPLFTRYLADGEHQRLADLVAKYMELVMFIIFPFVAGIIVAAYQIIKTLYGITFEPSVIPFTLLISSSFLTLLGQPFGNIISGAGKFYQLTWVNTIRAIIFFIALYFFLSEDFFNLGAIGLAACVLIGQMTEFVMFQIYAAKLTSGSFWRRKHLMFLGPIALLFGFYWLQWMGGFQQSYWSIAFGILSTGTIFAFLVFTKTLDNELMDQVGQIGSVKKLKSYIVKELTKNKDND